jgi:hypothetical protein
LGMNLQAEIEKATVIMAHYRMPREDQATVVKLLLNVGVEHCLAEQERVRAEKEAMIEHAQRHPLGKRLD